MLWMRDHRAEQVHELLISGMGRPDSDADLQSIRQVQQTMSSGGVVPAAALEAVNTFVYTDEFARE
jgi:hypothetical protein